MSNKRKELIHAVIETSEKITTQKADLDSVIAKACYENAWFTPEHCWLAIESWLKVLDRQNLSFFLNYPEIENSNEIGIIMAGNIPLVGFHDLLMVLISGHKALVKMSSDDKALMGYFLQMFKKHAVFSDRIEIVDSLPKQMDAVIATGSNNSYRYFEYYFRDIPHVLRRNRRSVAVLEGSESAADLQLIAQDALLYFGLGCRNVSLLFMPENMDITKVIDAFEGFAHFKDHNKHHNNYTYHKALFLMNQEQHLDNGFLLFKEEQSLNAPLGTLFYSRYHDKKEIQAFLTAEKENIQCIVGKNSKQYEVVFGESQFPDIQDFADKVDTMKFLTEL